MSKDMLTVPRDLLQDLIDDVADYAVSRTFKDRETTWRSDLLDRARALLARQPAAIDKQEAAMRDRARRFLSEFVRQTGISMSDHVQEVMLNLFLRYAAPLANEASKPACAHRIVDARNEIVKSGYLCVDCGAVFAGIHAPAAPSVEQDEQDMPPPLQNHQRSHAVSLYMSLPHNMDSAEAIITKVAADAYVNGFQTGKHCDASTSANVAQGAEAVSERIARALHYPACWDTAAYPTLESAVWEAIACAKLGCSTCEPAQTALTDDARDAIRRETLKEPVAQTELALTDDEVWQALKDIADLHSHPDDVVQAGRALLNAAQSASASEGK